MLYIYVVDSFFFHPILCAKQQQIVYMYYHSVSHVSPFRCFNGDWHCCNFLQYDFVTGSSFSRLHQQYCHSSSQKWILVVQRMAKWRLELTGMPVLQNPKKAILWKMKNT